MMSILLWIRLSWGNERLYEIMKEKEAIYAKEDFTEEDGNKASELEAEFADYERGKRNLMRTAVKRTVLQQIYTISRWQN